MLYHTVDKGRFSGFLCGFHLLWSYGNTYGDIDPAIIPYLMQHTDDLMPEDISSKFLGTVIWIAGQAQRTRDIMKAIVCG